jgi:uncharacterized protein YndB with AHSA1/START domain
VSDGGAEILIRKFVSASADELFRAWIEPERFARWFAPKPMTVTALRIDARPGGEYEIEVSGPTNGGKCGANSRVKGRFLVVDPGKRLSFTWFTAADPFGETTVVIDFRATDGGTELRLRHSGFADPVARDRHAEGWEQALGNLVGFLARDADAASHVVSVLVQAGRRATFDAVATADGIRKWWTPLVAGDETEGGRLRLAFAGLDEHIDLRLDRLNAPFSVDWTCVAHTDLAEWAGTRMHFAFIEVGENTTLISFAHIGLHPRLRCFDHCKVGWDHFLKSLAALVETGAGYPYVGRAAQ